MSFIALYAFWGLSAESRGVTKRLAIIALSNWAGIYEFLPTDAAMAEIRDL
jgi:hypothetical protein